MRKTGLLLAFALLGAVSAEAQKKNFDYKFYGQIRTDLFYNTRSNSETVDGLFYMYPQDIKKDPNGEDLNGAANGNFYTLYTRLGVDVKGPELGHGIRPSAKVEVDFRGSGTTYSMIRVRHAYFNLDFKDHSSLLVGQTWHPLYGDVSPDIMNLNMGAPYQPFSRAPQARYRFHKKKFQLTAAAVWQSQYLSVGPSDNNAGTVTTKKSQDFLKNSLTPEFYLSLDYKTPALQAGVGAEMVSMTPRTTSIVSQETPAGKVSQTYRVHERITSLSYEAHLKYQKESFLLAAKSILSSNLTQTSTVGGYGITSINPVTGEQEYAPLRTSHTWVNVMYGKKIRGGLFGGYLKNLGAAKDVIGVLGTGTNLDQLATISAEVSYNLPNWKFGLEYSYCNAWYGSNDSKGKVVDTHTVDNHRIIAVALFQF